MNNIGQTELDSKLRQKVSKEDFQCAAKGVIPLNVKSSKKWALHNLHSWCLLHFTFSCADYGVPTLSKTLI